MRRVRRGDRRTPLGGVVTMTVRERLAGLDRLELEQLMSTALTRLAFVRSTDPAYELSRLRRDFGFDEYQRAEPGQPDDGGRA